MRMTVDVDTLLEDLAHGRMIILVDDEDRENEGDLLVAARFATPELINFMAMYGRGLICLTLTSEHCQRLNLPMQTDTNLSPFGTNFTVSIEAAKGVTTGISAKDRATTIQAATNPHGQADDLVSPGHIFPIRSVPGGVLVRAGHTESGCDLTEMAGLFPAAVICEIMNEDGSMARMPELQDFASHHNINIGTIKSIIEYRLRTECLIVCEHETDIDTTFGRFHLKTYRDTIDNNLHFALVRGKIDMHQPILTRVMINSTVLDGLLLSETPHRWGLAEAMSRIRDEDLGIVLILSAEEKSESRLMQQIENRPHSPNLSGGNLRQYGLGAQILRDLGARKIRLLSNRLRMPNMEGFGLSTEEIVEP